jgi:hypothetical protein
MMAKATKATKTPTKISKIGSKTTEKSLTKESTSFS